MKRFIVVATVVITVAAFVSVSYAGRITTAADSFHPFQG